MGGIRRVTGAMEHREISNIGFYMKDNPDLKHGIQDTISTSTPKFYLDNPCDHGFLFQGMVQEGAANFTASARQAAVAKPQTHPIIQLNSIATSVGRQLSAIDCTCTCNFIQEWVQNTKLTWNGGPVFGLCDGMYY